MSVVTFPKKKRPQKALVVTKIEDDWFAVIILPPGPRDAEMFGSFAGDGVDFGDYPSALTEAINAWGSFGRDAGLLLVDAVRADAEGGAI